MHLQYDEDFIEAAIQSCVGGRGRRISSLQISRFHREREKLYNILDPDERNSAFFHLHLEWFREWGVEKALIAPLAEFPLVSEALKILVFRQSRGRNDEGTELYVNEAGDRTGVLAMRPERLGRELELKAFLRHELTHLHDMLDPVFGYEPKLPAIGPSVNQHRLARERYRLLWDITIDGRLTRAGRQTIATKDQRWLELVGAFCFWPESTQQEIFNSLWTNPTPNHRILVELVCDARHTGATVGPQPGAACPLCGFPTFAWASEARLTDAVVKTIRSEFPRWDTNHGACARCAEVYRVNSAQVSITV
jgi:hypothetical protein